MWWSLMRESTSASVEQSKKKKIKKLYLHITLFVAFARLKLFI